MSTSGNLYADLAGFYDRFCAEVDYPEQSAFARRAFECFGNSGGRRLLDLACGTGQHMEWLERCGFEVSGLDNSAAMLEQAALRCPGAELLLCDLAGFERREEFDLITCFLYSIHYSHPLAALDETLRRAWQALRPGGVFLFNAVDAAGVSNDGGVTTTLDDAEGTLSFKSAWRYRGDGEVLDLDLAITRRRTDGVESRWHDHHVMTATSPRRLRELLEARGFEVTMLEHDYATMQAWDEANFNAILVACKPRG